MKIVICFQICIFICYNKPFFDVFKGGIGGGNGLTLNLKGFRTISKYRQVTNIPLINFKDDNLQIVTLSKKLKDLR